MWQIILRYGWGMRRGKRFERVGVYALNVIGFGGPEVRMD